MLKPSFPSRARTRHRTPLTPAQRASRRRTLQRVTGGALCALAAVALVVLWPYPPLPVLVATLLVAVAVVVSDPDSPLLATVAPLPDVHTQPVATATGPIEVVHVMPARRSARPERYDDPLLATAQDAGVYVPRHACHTPTSVIPAVRA